MKKYLLILKWDLPAVRLETAMKVDGVWGKLMQICGKFAKIDTQILRFSKY